jgi:Luciferase-like monooxygenase
MGAREGGTAVKFGISLVPATEQLDRIRELVRAADEAELDVVGIQNHPYQRRFLDTWVLIAMLLAETRRIAFFTVRRRVGRDVESGMASGEVLGTPTLFIDGVVHRGGYDAAALLEALSS